MKLNVKTSIALWFHVSAPNQSSTENKTNLGLTPPSGGSVNPNNVDPDNKGFYENLPFHGMQNPPNKVYSRTYAGFKCCLLTCLFCFARLQFVPMFNPMKPQSAREQFNASFTTTHSVYSGSAFPSAAIKRHQSFHGFQNRNASTQNLSHSFLQPSLVPMTFWQQQSGYFVPTNFNLPQSTVTAFQNHSSFPYNQMGSSAKLNHSQQSNLISASNPFNTVTPTTRVVGRKESQTALRKVTSEIISKRPNSGKEKPISKCAIATEKRFGSLELKKHRCYSPTFYSLGCKKHAKKRPIIYAIPKHLKSQVASNNDTSSFQNLTDSIQISEKSRTPKPAPRCKKTKNNIIYQNCSNSPLYKKNAKAEDPKPLDSSNDSSENFSHEVSTTEVLVHESNHKSINKLSSSTPKSSSSSSTKDSPTTVMVKPSFVKPKVESPKGALSLQIQAKMKSSSTEPLPSSSDDNSSSKEANIDPVPFVPEMPILDTQNKWNTNKLNTSQVCLMFCFVLFCCQHS